MAPKLLPPELLYETVFFLPVDDVVPNAFVSCRMLHDFLLPRAIKLKYLMDQLRRENETLRQSQQSHQKEIESLRSELKSIQSELQSARQIIATLPHGRRAAAESEAEATDVEMRPDEEEEGGGADGLPGISTELVQINCLTFDQSGAYLAIGGSNLQIYQAKSWNCIAQFNAHSQAITGVCFADNAKSVVSASLDKSVRVHSMLPVPAE